MAAGEEISFAVNPDGTEVIAVVNSGPGFRQFSVYSAATGGATRLVHGPAASRGIVRLLTWSAAGPVAITDALAAFQGCEAGECSPWGHAAILDPASGTVGLPVGGADCLLWNIAGLSALCSVDIPPINGAAATSISIRNLDGSGGKPVPVMSYCSCFYDARLSPAGVVALLVSTTPGELASVIVRPDGTKSTVAVPAVTGGLGVLSAYTWWGDHTLVGVTTCGSTGCTQEGGAVATVDRTDPALHPFPLNHGGDPLATLIA